MKFLLFPLLATTIFATQESRVPAPLVECSLPGDEGRRVYQVVDAGSDRDPRWWLTLRMPELDSRRVELPLPGATVERTPARVAVSSRSANGGLAVEVVATDAGGLLDVFVNFELEVNVWRDLSPDVERMNTGGPRRDALCRTKN